MFSWTLAMEMLILYPAESDLERLAQTLLGADPRCVVGTRQILRDTLASKLWHTVPKWKEHGGPRLHLNNKHFLRAVCPEGVACLKAIGYRDHGNTIVYPPGTEPSQGFLLLGILNRLDKRTAERQLSIQQAFREQEADWERNHRHRVLGEEDIASSEREDIGYKPKNGAFNSSIYNAPV